MFGISVCALGFCRCLKPKRLIWRSTLINISINSCQTKLIQDAKPGNKLPYNIKMDVFIFMNLVVCEVTNHFNCWLRFKTKGSLTFKKIDTFIHFHNIFYRKIHTSHGSVAGKLLLGGFVPWQSEVGGFPRFYGWNWFHFIGTLCVCGVCVHKHEYYIVYLSLFVYIHYKYPPFVLGLL